MPQNNPQGFVRLYVLPQPAQTLLLVASEGDCLETALDVARSQAGIGQVEVDDQAGSDYIPPGQPAAAGTEQHYALFRYRLTLSDSTQAQQAAFQLETEIQRTLDRRGLDCEVILEVE